MKVFALLLACMVALTPSLAMAGKKGVYYALPEADKTRTDLATVILPEAIDIQMVDGIEYPGFKSLFRRGDIQVKVTPGEHQIALKYNQKFEWGDHQHEFVRSKVLVLGFTAEPGKIYRVEHDNFRTVDEARVGVQNLSLRMKDAAGNSVVFGAAQVSTNWQGEETVMKRTDLVSPDAAAAALAARAAASSATATPAISAAAVTASAATAMPGQAATGAAFESLKFTWQNASEADRAAFRAWINTAPAP